MQTTPRRLNTRRSQYHEGQASASALGKEIRAALLRKRPKSVSAQTVKPCHRGPRHTNTKQKIEFFSERLLPKQEVNLEGHQKFLADHGETFCSTLKPFLIDFEIFREMLRCGSKCCLQYLSTVPNHKAVLFKWPCLQNVQVKLKYRLMFNFRHLRNYLSWLTRKPAKWRSGHSREIGVWNFRVYF